MSREVLHNNCIRALIKFIQKWRFGEYLFRCETSFRDKRSIASVDATWYGGGGHSEKGDRRSVDRLWWWRWWGTFILLDNQIERNRQAKLTLQVWFESGICTACDGAAGDITGQDSEVTFWHFGHFDTAVMLINDNNLILHQKLRSIWYSVVT